MASSSQCDGSSCRCDKSGQQRFTRTLFLLLATIELRIIAPFQKIFSDPRRAKIEKPPGSGSRVVDNTKRASKQTSDERIARGGACARQTPKSAASPRALVNTTLSACCWTRANSVSESERAATVFPLFGRSCMGRHKADIPSTFSTIRTTINKSISNDKMTRKPRASSSTAADESPTEGNEDEFNSDVPETRWPEALPSPQEEAIITAVCGNSSIQWGAHQGPSYGYAPSCCWK